MDNAFIAEAPVYKRMLLIRKVFWARFIRGNVTQV
jgi:hypothetical protein